jgi:hypothetical protein
MNYQNKKIYKITSFQTNKIYIGSTAQPKLCSRMSQHKNKYNNYLNGIYAYMTSFELLKYTDAKIELIELYPYNSKNELIAREAYWMRQLDCVNKVISGRTNEQYREENKEKILKKKKQYYLNNKNNILATNKKY